MNKMLVTAVHREFNFEATEISKYLYSSIAGLFTVALKSGKCIHYEPTNPMAFKEWLDSHNITDIKSTYLR